MNYPPYIYRDLSIIEKDIYGEKHYAVVERRSFLLFSWQKKIKLYGDYQGYGYESGMGNVWHNRRHVCESAIKDMHRKSEWSFEQEVTK